MKRDLALLMAARSIRSFAFGFVAVLLGVHLQDNGIEPLGVGVAITVAIAAASVSQLIAVRVSARFGRRLTLAAIGVLMALSGLDLAVAHSASVLVLGGITGMLGAAGPDLGPFLPLEQALLVDASTAQDRNQAFGRYALIGALAASLGSLSASLGTSAGRINAFFLLLSLIGVGTVGLALMLSPDKRSVPSPISMKSIQPILGLSGLFALDSLGSGLTSGAVVVYWLHLRFAATPEVLGPAFAAMALLSALSFELSWRLADRFGLVNTMVFSHLPGAILLLAIPFISSLDGVLAVLIIRSLVVNMDEPTGQAYIASIVPANERGVALAFTGTVRGLAVACGPVVTAFAIQAAAFGIPFFLAGGSKVVYDGALFAAFRHRLGDHEVANKAAR
jgi:MFS family permease